MRIRILARGGVANPALTQLPQDAHFSGGILANANWFIPIFEFPPTPFPINHGHKTVEGRRNGFGCAVFHPHTEPRRMFTFIGAGGWSAHSFILWANPALEVRGVLPIRRNWTSKHLAKIPLKLAKEFGRPEPFSFPTCAMLCTFAPDLPSGSGTAGGNITERNYPMYSS
jgi:hypothetical protein